MNKEAQKHLDSAQYYLIMARQCSRNYKLREAQGFWTAAMLETLKANRVMLDSVKANR